MKILRNQSDLNKAIGELVSMDPHLAFAVERAGKPELRVQRSGFEGLVSILVSQQVSVAAARAIEARLFDLLPDPHPAAFMDLTSEQCRGAGLSAPKQRYLRELSSSILSGQLDLDRFDRLSDEEIRAQLQAVKGVGPWSANIYLMFALRRADSFAGGDLALQEGYRRLAALDARPSANEMDAIATRWSPYRAAAALILWRYYAHVPSVEIS